VILRWVSICHPLATCLGHRDIHSTLVYLTVTQDLHLKSPVHVKLMGKGRKERIVPIWPETAELISALLRRRPRQPYETVFVNRYGEPPTASGFRFRLRSYVKARPRRRQPLVRKRITSHVFRHTTAVHLISAGVDVTVIRSWSGHASLDTTNHYAQASLETKRRSASAGAGRFQTAPCQAATLETGCIPSREGAG
jgi:integrase